MEQGNGRPGFVAALDRAVLLVERSPELRERLAALVSEIPGTRLAGTATSAGEALLWLTSLRFDAVLVDVALLAPSRLEALRSLRLAAPTARLVVLAGDADAAVRERCRALGADAVLGSAVEFERLEEVLTAPAAPPAPLRLVDAG
jgi:two-component system, OmpR family, response regulator